MRLQSFDLPLCLPLSRLPSLSRRLVVEQKRKRRWISERDMRWFFCRWNTSAALAATKLSLFRRKISNRAPCSASQSTDVKNSKRAWKSNACMYLLAVSILNIHKDCFFFSAPCLSWNLPCLVCFVFLSICLDNTIVFIDRLFE